MRLMALGLAMAGAVLGGCTSVQGQQVVRSGSAEAPIAATVSVPPGAELVYVSGSVPEALNPAAPAGSVERYGDTETQTRSVLSKIEVALKERGLTLGEVVMMRVFLMAPPGQPRMDFAGMMRAYRERFGTPAQPNKPARSTMQVAGLVDPGWLVEIEVTAARAPGLATR
jgi:enamine deaminase RidA (YjgF/YER057c/UK114 family)